MVVYVCHYISRVPRALCAVAFISSSRPSSACSDSSPSCATLAIRLFDLRHISSQWFDGLDRETESFIYKF